MTSTPDKTTMFTPASRKDWRKWLEDNNSSKDEIWLVYYKKHTSIPTISYNDSVEEAICFGWIDGIKKRIDDERYCHRFTPRTASSMWSETNVKRAKDMIGKGLMKETGLKHYKDALNNPARLIVNQRTKASTGVPEDLVEALKNNGKAYTYFISLSSSYRNMCILWINDAKRQETRNKRIGELVEKSASGMKIGMK